MPQLHCYVQDDLAKRLQEKASQAHFSVSRYLALLIEKEVGSRWPEDYFDLFGGWQGERLQRPAQGSYEKRTGLE